MATPEDFEALGAVMWAIGRALPDEAKESIAADLSNVADVAASKGRSSYAERLRFLAASVRRG